jgi:hypothetical protein
MFSLIHLIGSEKAKNPRQRSSKIFMKVTHGVVQARCLLDYQMFSLQVANKPVMHDIKRHIKL